MEQLRLNFVADEESVKRHIEEFVGQSVSLKLTDNSTSMISVRSDSGKISLRLHRMFLGAGQSVLDEVAKFAKKRRGATPLVREFIKANSHLLTQKKKRQERMKTTGRYHDLREIFNAINRDYFGGRIDSSITWSISKARRCARKRTLGSYSRHTNVIRINPLLDQKRVPGYFVSFIVYHEMLHADIGVEKRETSTVIHSKEFRRRERLFKNYERAIAWEKTCL